jgi:hypothetical protein
MICANIFGAEKLTATRGAANPLEIHSVTVGGRNSTWRLGQDLQLWSAPEQIVLNFGPATGSGWHSIKHAKASELTVRVGFNTATLTVDVQDNGCGFDGSAHPAGSGLSNMRRRLADLHGTFRIVRIPNVIGR